MLTQVLRQSLQCSLPIEVVYSSEEDMSAEWREKLEVRPETQRVFGLPHSGHASAAAETPSLHSNVYSIPRTPSQSVARPQETSSATPQALQQGLRVSASGCAKCPSYAKGTGYSSLITPACQHRVHTTCFACTEAMSVPSWQASSQGVRCVNAADFQGPRGEKPDLAPAGEVCQQHSSDPT